MKVDFSLWNFYNLYNHFNFVAYPYIWKFTSVLFLCTLKSTKIQTRCMILVINVWKQKETTKQSAKEHSKKFYVLKISGLRVVTIYMLFPHYINDVSFLPPEGRDSLSKSPPYWIQKYESDNLSETQFMNQHNYKL